MKQSDLKEKLNNLEMSILSCLLQRSELFEQCTLTHEHFTYNKQIFLFMKNFYESYKMFDINLMVQKIVPRDKNKFIDKLINILDYEPAPSLYKHYKDLLIKTLEEDQTTRNKILRINDLTMDLIGRKINLEEFKKKVGEV